MRPSGLDGERPRKADLKLVGRVPRERLADGAMVRLAWPPFDVLVSMVDGVPYAIEAACNHAGANLEEGERRGSCVICPMHGYRFDLTSGRLVQPLGLCDDQRCFVARIVGDEIVVWDPGAAITIVPP
jgi:nitrite reductase/ring-hydroxylating ferredoxin subunit